MYFYKEVTKNGELVLLLTYDQKPNITNPLVIEITQEEYETFAAELQAKAETDQETGEAETTTEQEQKAQAYDILIGNEEAVL